MQLPPLPCYLALLGPNILLITLFSNTLGLLSSLNVRDQIPHLYKTTSNIIVLYNFIITTIIYYYGLNELKIFPSRWQKLEPAI